MPRRYTKGATVAQPLPFTVFPAEAGTVAVRIGKQKPFFTADEVIVSAAPVFITSRPDGLHIRGEGVVRRHGRTIAITS